jgi:hypothetical protein
MDDSHQNEILNYILFHFPKNKYDNSVTDKIFKLNQDKQNNVQKNKNKKNLNDIYFANIAKSTVKINDFHFYNQK